MAYDFLFYSTSVIPISAQGEATVYQNPVRLLHIMISIANLHSLQSLAIGSIVKY
jgi:hypothetical protein